ncbi:predicted protein [Ostreococcus lucimarinus CCE9901]|uniref:Uncharacterized protein n=1 Tax=Ostreococcus lucimarinus (strain CCE9901) TaxID=436017 RepID=A4SAP3_OSTLU|nr:predicted protein [Ostreococcus lucimarinus CCE9901]ABP00960.1 predicted protein [Ostreococcus lucimarinus CCE9901]|eukprot:XP_001422643.1 predicted protein [Ostreococcus lucimarinus CCE9901]
MKGFESFEAYRDAFAQATLDIAALPEGKKLTGARQIVILPGIEPGISGLRLERLVRRSVVCAFRHSWL